MSIFDNIKNAAQDLLEANRDKIPDALEGTIENAIETVGDKVEGVVGDSPIGGLLDKVGLGGDNSDAAESVSEEEATEEESEETA